MAEKKPITKFENKKPGLAKFRRSVSASVTMTRPKKELNPTETGAKQIGELKSNYAEILEVDVKLQRETYNLEKQFEKQYIDLFEERFKILEEFKNEAEEETGLSFFWLKVLKASYKDFITANDEEVLKHLIDIRSKMYNELPVKFVLEFHFEPNEFFSNLVLDKTYFIQSAPDKDDPLNFDGAEIYKCKGCKIDWKVDRVKGVKDNASFFEFFSPPELPENPDDPTFDEVNGYLQNDFEVGSYLKERVVPKAVMFYTGEIDDCAVTDSDTGCTDECSTSNVTSDPGSN